MLTAVSAALSDVLLFNLTADERQSLRTMGDKSMAFVQKALEYGENNPDLLPNYLDLPEAQKDYALSRDLYSVLQQVDVLKRSVEDAMMVVGSEAYDAALIYYNSIKAASRGNVPGAEAIYNDLQQRFAMKPKKAVAK